MTRPPTALHAVLGRSRRLSPRTTALYGRALDAFVGFAGPGPWTGSQVEAWRDLLAATRRPATVNVAVGAVRYASRRLADLGMAPDFARAAELLRVPKATRRVLSLAEVRHLLSTCNGGAPSDLRDRAMLLLGVRAGLRRAEIVGLARADVGRGLARVLRKGGRAQEIPLDDETAGAVRAWQAWLSRRGAAGPLFPALRLGIDAVQVGRAPMTADGFYRMLRGRAARAGLEGVHPHALRHTFVTLALAAGTPLDQVALLAGHADPKTTLGYAHLAPGPEGRARLPAMV